MVEFGANDFEISETLGVHQSTLIQWKTKYPEFAEAMRFRDENGTFADERVKRSLLHKATGYTYHSEKIFYDKDEGVVRVPVVEHVPPSDTAMIFYLKNRNPENWSDRKELDVRSTVSPITASMTAEEAMRVFEAVLKGASTEPLLIEGSSERNVNGDV
jgi:hypothetical protein